MDFVTGFASLVTAVATAVLAYLTYRVIQANQALVRATERQAQIDAEMLSGVKFDREAAIAPYLTFEFGARYTDEGWAEDVSVRIANIGRGPALSCDYVACYGWQGEPVTPALPADVRNHHLNYYLSARFHLGAGHAVEYSLSPIEGHMIDVQTILYGINPGLGVTHLAVCEDQLGTRYRFRPDVAKPETMKPGADRPVWADWVNFR